MDNGSHEVWSDNAFALSQNDETESQLTVKLNCLLLLAGLLTVESILAAVELSFSLTSNGPLDSGSRSINIEMELRDEEGVAEKWALQYENEPKSLDDEQKLAVCKWYLSRFQFVNKRVSPGYSSIAA